jgi:hypothetical protein
VLRIAIKIRELPGQLRPVQDSQPTSNLRKHLGSLQLARLAQTTRRLLNAQEGEAYLYDHQLTLSQAIDFHAADEQLQSKMPHEAKAKESCFHCRRC